MTDTLWLIAAGVVFLIMLYVLWDAWRERRRGRDPWRLGTGEHPYMPVDDINAGMIKFDNRPFMPGRKDMR